MKPATKLAVILLSLVAAAHLLRLAFGVPVTVGGEMILGGAVVDAWVAPMWVSVLGALIPGGLAWFMYRENS